jgi:DNA mismatch repair protein MutS
MYRLGDFYECFFEDALNVSRELELTLTSRDCGSGKRAAMCGVPFHKADVHVGRLVERGFKVAICEQVENPKEAQGIVKREVTRVVTPGTITDSALLTDGKNNYLMSISFSDSSAGIAVADISTGEVSATYIDGKDYLALVENEINAYQPSELICNIPISTIPRLEFFIKDRTDCIVSEGERALFSYDKAKSYLDRVFGDEAKKLPTVESEIALGALLRYIEQTQKSEITFVKDINVYKRGQFLDIDINTRRNLELVESMRNKEKRGSLLWVLDQTKTAMGARLLRHRILRPLIDPVEISHRLDAVEDLIKNRRIADELSELLAPMLDIERLTARAVYGTANARDLRAIYVSIANLSEIKAKISELKSGTIKGIVKDFDTLDDIADMLGRAIVDTPPLTVREGGMIREGFNSDVDYYRQIKSGGTDIMAAIEEREKQETGIKTLRVDYNKVFGYYIEVSKSYTDQVPPRFVRKQTLTNCERYITQELKDMENTIFGAEEKLTSLEYEIFNTLREFVSENRDRIRNTASLVAEIDLFRSLAEVASKNNYVRPEVDLSTDIVIKDGRHPVVEKFVQSSYFVPNDTTLDTGANKVMIITGPNMAGKSTYMRQVAIIVIMAQIGSFVPARDAKIGIVDKVFTRVGASDDLASGQSTFMLEMSEVAAILKNATKRSLVIYDEVGRGTSTYDGMSIARAVVKYTYSKKIGAKTLFATHYHELTNMEDSFPGIVNYNIAAKKRGDSITFLRKIVRGGTDDSYGIEVAKLAGVPNEVVNRAREILKELEAGGIVKPCERERVNDAPDLFSQIVMSKDGEVADKIRQADINTMTPIEALNLIYDLKKLLED